MRLINETEYQELLAKIPMEERTFRKAVEVAEDMPTIDAVQVVRCRECRHSRPLSRTEPLELTFVEGCVWCEEHADGVYENDFCSYGERREGDGDA